MKSIVIASKNPVKARATIKAFKRMFPEESFRLNSVSVPSGVGRQPASDDETLQGAATRARNASREIVNANYWVGIELVIQSIFCYNAFVTIIGIIFTR